MQAAQRSYYGGGYYARVLTGYFNNLMGAGRIPCRLIVQPAQAFDTHVSFTIQASTVVREARAVHSMPLVSGSGGVKGPAMSCFSASVGVGRVQ